MDQGWTGIGWGKRCVYVRTDKKGWIRGVQVNGRAERCVYVRTEMKGWIRGVQVIGWR